jgi:hypothetical protein
MMLPSLYMSGYKVRTWSVARAAAYGAGAGIGALAALFKTLAPLHGALAVGERPAGHFLTSVPEIAGVALGFALLCTLATAVRNVIARRLVWRDFR